MAVRLLERESVLSAVEALLDGARAGEGGALFVVGDAGAGKTSILAAVRAAATGLRVGSGRGSVAEAVLPFGILEQALAAVGEGSPLDAAPGDAGVVDARAARFHASVRWLQAAAARQPTLLVLDDLHWADGDSLTLLDVICRRLAGHALAVVAALRPHPPSALGVAHALEADATARVETLRPLSAGAASELIRGRVDAPLDDAALLRATLLCAGNPLLLEEAARVLGAGDSLPEAGTAPPVRALILSRLVAGDAEALRYGRCAAVLGVSFRPALAGELASLTADVADAVLEQLCRSGLVRDAGAGRGEFVHPLFRQALLESLDGPVRARLHARAFELLAGRGSAPAEAAEHAVAGHLAGDPEAIRVLEVAGRDALRVGAASTAAGHLRSAVELAGSAAAAATRVALAEALLLSGGEAEVVGLCEGVLEDAAASPADRAAALAVLGRADFHRGDYAASTERYAAALRIVEGVDPALQVEILLDLASVAFFAAGPGPALPLAARARALAAGCGAPTRAIADCAWSFAALAAGEPGGLEVAAAGARVVQEHGLTARAASIAWYGCAAALRGREEEAGAALTLARRWAEFGDPAIRALIIATAAELEARTGHLARALASVEGAGVHASGLSMAETYVGSIRAAILLDAGDVEGGDALAERLEAATAVQRGDGLARLRLGLLRLRRRLRTAQVEAAAAEARGLEQLAAELGLAEPCLLPWARDAVSAHLAAGALADVERLAGWLQVRGATLDCPWSAAAGWSAQAALRELAGDIPAAIGAHEEGLRILERVTLPLERSRSLCDLGALLRRAGRIAGAREVLAAAVRLAEEAGAAGVAARPLEELRLAGGRRRAARPADDALTSAELRVARLAARGATNAEISRQLFLSVKTIDTHLQHIYGKLGIRSRRALIPLARRFEEE
ncbi:MAG TPA: AAA family ATPase [Candidatus Dormibacteraeota bacterium]